MTNITVSAGQTVAGVALSAGDTLTIRSGGTAIGTVVNDGGVQNVDGGENHDTVLNSGGVQYQNTGRTYDPTLNGGSLLSNEGSVDGPLINGGVLANTNAEITAPIIAGGGSLTSAITGFVTDPKIIDGSIQASDYGIGGAVDFVGHGSLVLRDTYRFGFLPSYAGDFVFGAPLVGFGSGDAVDLTRLAFAGATSKVTVSGSTLKVTNGFETVTLRLVAPKASAFSLSNDGSVGTLVSAVDDRNVITGRAIGYETIQGSAGDDVITAFNVADHIFANGGNDTINAGKGEAKVDVANGDVTVNLNGYNNVVVGGNGDDVVSGSQGNSTVSLGNGSDDLNLGGYLNTVVLGNGDNIVGSGRGGASVSLGNGDNRVNISEYSNVVKAGNGDNVIVGGDGGETITLGNGDNGIVTSGLGNSIKVGSGSNTIVAGRGSDAVSAGAGTDAITLAGTSNTVTLKGTDATVDGGLGSDFISATGGDDTFIFRGYKDHLTLGGNVSANVTDLAHGLRVDVASSTQNDVVTGFDQDRSAVVDLLNGAGGFSSISQLVSALHSDRHGGTMLSLGQGGSIDFLNTSLANLHASNFELG